MQQGGTEVRTDHGRSPQTSLPRRVLCSYPDDTSGYQNMLAVIAEACKNGTHLSFLYAFRTSCSEADLETRRAGQSETCLAGGLRALD